MFRSWLGGILTGKDLMDVGTNKMRWREFLFGFEILIFTFIPTAASYGIVFER
jgi:hypothetical protein